MQHRIAKMLTNLLLIGDKKNSNENILILYGIEVFLNEFTKIIVSLILGILLGIGYETVFTVLMLLILRRIGGGRHFRTNYECFMISVLILVGVPKFAYIINKSVNFSYNNLIFLVLVEIVFIALQVPYKARPLIGNSLFMNKFIVIIIYLVCVVACIIISNYIMFLIICLITLVQIFSDLHIPSVFKNRL